MANKLTTMGYIIKRLRDSGYVAFKLFSDYGIGDPRAWTVMIAPGVASVFCTCYINDPYIGETFFEIYDGNQFIPGRLKIQTSSFEIIVEHLVKYGIIGTEIISKDHKVELDNNF
ncbi:MAG: hypothetical protein RL709_83 [Pseudomonadota bacterium]|jgi:hypothetical protein